MAILVSISCITYNQEKYIAQALDSFLMQQTDFEYEILVHDDASTDSTAAIIREYASQYPEIIKPLFQVENQYSKGIRVGTRYNLPRAKGQYIAQCEGDDYWTDPSKLQKQIDYLQGHPECSMCFHAVQVVKKDRKPTGRLIRPYHEDRIVPIEDLITGGGTFLNVNSIVYLRHCMDNPPGFYFQAPVGDIPLALHLASQGTVYYFNQVMSAYRTGVRGSWIDRVSASRDKEIEVRNALIQMTAEFDRYTHYKYADAVAKRQYENELLLLIAKGDVKSETYKKFRQELGIYVAAMIYLKKYCPALYDKLRIHKKYLVSKISIK